MANRKPNSFIPQEMIETKIYLIRGEKVMLDRDLAELYGVSVKRLKEQVKRNLTRFPADFMIRLDFKEFSNLRSQIATSSWGGQRYLPFAFTENGVAMLSSILNSDRAIMVNIQIMRTFTRIRKLLASHKEILRKLDQLEARQSQQGEQIVQIFQVIKAILDLPITLKHKSKRIGFKPPAASQGS
ncbi:MAG: ORF6N domain-containing protein [candidate division FCPU426 bacterium]